MYMYIRASAMHRIPSTEITHLVPSLAPFNYSQQFILTHPKKESNQALTDLALYLEKKMRNRLIITWQEEYGSLVWCSFFLARFFSVLGGR